MAGGDPTAVTDRIVTWPNLISVVRLLGVPLFLWLVLGPEADGWALVVLMLAGVTDYLDGKLARKLNQATRLGRILDPVADRLYILAVVVGLAIRESSRGGWPSSCRCATSSCSASYLSFAPAASPRCPCTSWARRPPLRSSTRSRCCSSVTVRLAGHGGIRRRLGVHNLGVASSTGGPGHCTAGRRVSCCATHVRCPPNADPRLPERVRR